MESEALLQFFERLNYEWDDREFPDRNRQRNFLIGWKDATEREKKYKDATLLRLTWQNLGYRSGKYFGGKSEQEIQDSFNVLSSFYKGENQIFTKEDEKDYREGKLTQVLLTRKERNRAARKACIAYFGAVCQVCEIDFEKTYGEIGKGFIHVHHHTEMMSNQKGEYEIDPIKDLIPVCPNCHAMIHIGKKNRSIDDMRIILKKSKNNC